MKAQKLLFLLILSGMMSFIVSGISTFKAVGLNHHFVSLWLSAWIIAWILAFPSVLICAPIAQKLVDIIFKKVENVCKLKRTKLAVICGYSALVFFHNI
jgi:TRAP-type C4-dicarboxylate transport system permease small subunit